MRLTRVTTLSQLQGVLKALCLLTEWVFASSRVQLQQQLLISTQTIVKKSGSTMTGALQVTRPGTTTAGTYVFSVKSDGLGDKPVSFRVTADGGVKAGHDTSHPFMASSANDVVTKKYLDDRIAAIPEPEVPVTGGPTTKYDGNRFCVGSDRGAALSEGDVRFMAIDGTNVTNIALIQRVGLPASEFDWDKCTKAGVLKVKNGATVVGWLHVYDVDDVGTERSCG